jgi:hypothetical protein
MKVVNIISLIIIYNLIMNTKFSNIFKNHYALFDLIITAPDLKN